MGYHNLKERIKSNEGFSSKPYKDQLGYLTIGYGHLILPNENILLKKQIHKKELEEIFEKDFKNAINDFCKKEILEIDAYFKACQRYTPFKKGYKI